MKKIKKHYRKRRCPNSRYYLCLILTPLTCQRRWAMQPKFSLSAWKQRKSYYEGTDLEAPAKGCMEIAERSNLLPEAQWRQQLQEARQQEGEQQKRELARLWKELVHKANPTPKWPASNCLYLPRSLLNSAAELSCELQTPFRKRSRFFHQTRGLLSLSCGMKRTHFFRPMPDRAYQTSMNPNCAENCYPAMLRIIMRFIPYMSWSASM